MVANFCVSSRSTRKCRIGGISLFFWQQQAWPSALHTAQSLGCLGGDYLLRYFLLGGPCLLLGVYVFTIIYTWLGSDGSISSVVRNSRIPPSHPRYGSGMLRTCFSTTEMLIRSQMLGGALIPGKPVANMYFTMYGYNPVLQALALLQDLKLVRSCSGFFDNIDILLGSIHETPAQSHIHRPNCRGGCRKF
jgi:OPT oligopeptide transporter protein